MNNKNDEKALNLLTILKEKKEKIAKLSKPHYETNMTFHNPIEHTQVNLNVVNNVETLIKLYSIIKNAIKDYEDASKDLGMEESEDSTFEGFTLKQWKNDFQTKIDVLNIRKEKETLKIMEEKINGMISQEKRTELELELLEKELSK